MIAFARLLVLLIWSVSLAGCHDNAQYLFSRVPRSESNISFSNDIKEDKNQNILTYEYLYNGGGVAAGDVNNDGLTDIFVTGNMKYCQLYLNKGKMKFEEISEKAGVKGRERWKTGAAMADVNGDGLLDIYVCYSGSEANRSNELYINKGIVNGIPVFAESGRDYGLDAPETYSTIASFFDMDNDGDLDMFLVNHADMFFNPFFNTAKLRQTRNPKFGNRLYRNDNGKFTDISDSAGISGSGLNFGLSVSTSDINNDGFTDIYVTNDYDERDFLYINNKNGTFREVLTSATGHISEFAMGSDIADFNNDARSDIVVLDMLPEDNHRQKLLKGADTYDKYTLRTNAGFHHQQMRNTLQLNNGNDTSGNPIFSEIGQLAGISATDWSWSALFADLDNDGWKDLVITNGILRDITNLDFVKYTSGYSSAYNNKKGSSDKEEMWELIQQMPSAKLSNYLFKNNRQLTFENATYSWGFTEKGVSNGAVYADFDNDGDLDLFVNNLNQESALYRNNASANVNSHYLQLQLVGTGKNTSAIGAKVYLRTKSGVQFQEQFLTRGFQSSVSPIMHFGIGGDSTVTSLTVVWPGGATTTVDNVAINQRIIIEQKNANGTITNTATRTPDAKFIDVTKTSGVHFTHRLPTFVDFKITPLLPYQISKIGPALAKADVNGDGLEDLFIGAASAQESQLYFQQKDGAFTLAQQQPWNNNTQPAVTDALFFDADGDGDADLYLVSGGADAFLNSKNYQDRFFMNNGEGNFKEITDALPIETASGSCVRVTDIDHDGLPDIFVGNKINPGQYPTAPPSMLLKNKSGQGKIRFEKGISQTDTTFSNLGMVTDAAWADLNKDGWDDLTIVGEFMPVMIFLNQQGKLINASDQSGLKDSDGWWSRILTGDFDRDGDTDMVIGNLGTNAGFTASRKEPLSIVYGDFYNNETINPVLCQFKNGVDYPYYSRDEMIDQIPSLNKKFLHYSDYADAQLTDIFTENQLQVAKKIYIKTLQSVYLENTGNGKMSIKPLPPYAQFSPINGMVTIPNKQSGYEDIVIAGNCFPMRAQIGPLDASFGIIMENRGRNNFSVQHFRETGLLLRGDIRNMIKIKSPKGDYIVVSKSNDSIQLIQIKN